MTASEARPAKRSFGGFLRERALASASPLDLAAAGLFVLLAAVSLVHGFDAAILTTSDALYPVQMLEYGLLDFRPPPPNRIFPDVAVHALIAPFIGDLLAQKIAAGAILFAASAAMIGLYQGVTVFFLFVIIMASCGFGFLDSACHYSLPLLALLFQLSRRNRLAEGPVLALVVFSDMLILIPLAIVVLDRAERGRLVERALIIGAAGLANTLYSEFGEALLKFAIVLPPWIAAVWLADRLGHLRAFAMATAGGLVIASLAGVVPARYGLPVSAAMVVLLAPVLAARFDWRYVVAPATLIGLFLATMDTTRASRLETAFACLNETLAARGIETVATDYWTAKPLYFAARGRGNALTITQVDFAESDSHMWMSPYDFHGRPTPWAVRNRDACANIDGDAKYCGQADAAPVISQEAVCGNFDIYRYASPVPAHYEARPAGKAEAITRRFAQYLGKVLARIGLAG